jgi:hypothetical protein
LVHEHDYALTLGNRLGRAASDYRSSIVPLGSKPDLQFFVSFVGQALPLMYEEENMANQHHSKRWSADVTEHSDALDLKEGIFTSDDPREIAGSLKRSAEQSHRRKADPFRSAMSMLTFYINRAGDNLSSRRRRTLEAAKGALRARFGRG